MSALWGTHLFQKVGHVWVLGCLLKTVHLETLWLLFTCMRARTYHLYTVIDPCSWRESRRCSSGRTHFTGRRLPLQPLSVPESYDFMALTAIGSYGKGREVNHTFLAGARPETERRQKQLVLGKHSGCWLAHRFCGTQDDSFKKSIRLGICQLK